MKKPLYQWTITEALTHLQKLDRKSQARILVIVAGMLGFGAFIFWPAWMERPQIEYQIYALQSQIQLSQAQIELEPKLLEEEKEYEAFVKTTQENLFTEEETQGLLGILAELGEKSRVKLLSSSPQRDDENKEVPDPLKKYALITYLITVEGGYFDLAAFVKAIESHPKLIRVVELSITPQEEFPGRHIAELVLSVVLLQEGTG